MHPVEPLHILNRSAGREAVEKGIRSPKRVMS
jgi:hypothetical protein